MNAKQAKKMRREIRKRIEEESTDEYLPPIPLAGCPMCNHKTWYVRLDQPPPNHEVIVSIICANSGCNQQVGINLNIEEHARSQSIYTDDPKLKDSEPRCPECGFDVYDCQCDRINAANP